MQELLVEQLLCLILASFSVFFSPVCTSWLICDRLIVGFVCSIALFWGSDAMELETFSLSSRDKVDCHLLPSWMFPAA
jgi:hypothetical protein